MLGVAGSSAADVLLIPNFLLLYPGADDMYAVSIAYLAI